MHIERIACLEEEWIKVLTELGRPDALLACTYAFQHDFFSSLLDRLKKEAVCGSVRATDGLELTNPIDVICDRHRYEGHKVGFNVHFWDKDARLFHPKLMIGLFGKRVVWSSGSLNLTRAGWMRNRELAMFHTPARPILPRSLRALLKELPANASASSILKATVDGPDRIGSSIFVSSLNQPIGPHFLRGLPSDAHAVHLVAPFFDRKESGGNSLDLSWMESLSGRCPKAAFHLYLPLLNEEELLVQGDARVFRSFEKHLRRSGRNL